MGGFRLRPIYAICQVLCSHSMIPAGCLLFRYFKLCISLKQTERNRDKNRMHVANFVLHNNISIYYSCYYMWSNAKWNIRRKRNEASSVLRLRWPTKCLFRLPMIYEGKFWRLICWDCLHCTAQHSTHKQLHGNKWMKWNTELKRK